MHRASHLFLLLLLLVVAFDESGSFFVLGFVKDTGNRPAFASTRRPKKVLSPTKHQHHHRRLFATNNHDNHHPLVGVPEIDGLSSSNTKQEGRAGAGAAVLNVDDDIIEETMRRIANMPTAKAAATAAGLVLFVASAPAEAAASTTSPGVIPSALWAYAHYASIISIFGILSAEKTLIKPGMTQDEESTVVKLDLIYGLLAVLLIVSGFFRASSYGKGSDFYLHETLFWVKMTFSGIWGGLSLFPSLTYYKRKLSNKENPPISEKLAARLQQIINAEITAMLSIPLVATLMSRGVLYWDDLYWPAGLAISVTATVGSFYLYGKQALTWAEDDVVEEEQEVAA